MCDMNPQIKRVHKIETVCCSSSTPHAADDDDDVDGDDEACVVLRLMMCSSVVCCHDCMASANRDNVLRNARYSSYMYGCFC